MKKPKGKPKTRELVGIVAFAILITLSSQIRGCREDCEADMNGARRILVIQHLIREGDSERLQTYLDTQLKMDLYGIAFHRRWFIRPRDSMDVATDVVDYFDTYRAGDVERHRISNKEHFNHYLRGIAEETRRRKVEQPDGAVTQESAPSAAP